jgi:transposase
VRDSGIDPFSGLLYVFWAKRADRVKIVWCNSSGICLYAKLLKRFWFCWPQIGAIRVNLNHAKFIALLD